MPDTGGTLRKTTHKTIGHAPASLADYATAFSPNTASGGWHRGDGNHSVHGVGWSLYGFNDFFVSDGAGGVNALFRRNAVLMIDSSTGVVSWLSSGDQFPLPGSVTFPSNLSDGTQWCWLKGGWATGAASAILIAGQWTAAGEGSIRVMGIAGITGASPTCSAVVTTDLSTTIRWSGQPFRDGGYVYLHGIKLSTFGQHVARHAYSADPADYATGWTYWSGSTWVSSVGSAGAMIIAQPGLAAINVVPWAKGYLGCAKLFDTSPEIAIPDVWPEIQTWWSPTVYGPWQWCGHLYQPVTLTDWYSYLARIDFLPGIDTAVAFWSLNKGSKSIADHSIYGPQLALAVQPAGGHGTVTATAAPPGSLSAQGAAVGSGPALNLPLGSAESAAIRIGSGTTTAARVGSAETGEG